VSLDFYELLAAVSFVDERRVHYCDLVDETEREMLFRDRERVAHELAKREAGFRWAVALGLSPVLGPIVSIMIFDATRDHRQRAASLICRALRRAARRAA